jgi:ribosomal protein L19E
LQTLKELRDELREARQDLKDKNITKKQFQKMYDTITAKIEKLG